MIEICLIGAGRIGSIHAVNIAHHPDARLHSVVDADQSAARSLANIHDAQAMDVETAFADKNVDAVVIASSTDTHADMAMKAAGAGKAIFCEKPIDLSLERVDACLGAVEAAGVPLQIGFNRRFDPSFAALRQSMAEGRIGKTEQVIITSRDPSPPPLSYIKVSGGLFRDMMIHDFDMARFLLGEEPTEVFAWADCLIDPAIGEAGDVDTAMVLMRTPSGALCQISNSRRAVYGYDQRIEVFGSDGMLRADNITLTTVEHATINGVASDNPLHFFLERYAEAYRLELDHFIQSLKDDTPPLATGADGRMAIVLAECAIASLEKGVPVPVPQS